MAWSEWKKFGNCDVNTTPTVELLNAGTTQKLNKEFTATSDGVVFIWANRGYTGRSVIVKINNTEVVNYNKVENANPLRKVISIKKGDLLNLSIVGAGGDDFIGVYYFE